MISRSVVSAVTAKRAASPSLYFCSAAEPLCPLTARIHPLAEHSTVTGSRSTSASAGISIGSGAAAISVRRRPSGVSPPNSAAVADDPDHLVEIDIDDDLAVQDLHAAGNRCEAVTALALQHHPEVVEKGLQRLLQVHHPWDAERVEHIEIERHADFEVGQPEEL